MSEVLYGNPKLDQRMGGGDVDGHGLHTAWGVEPSKTDAHGDAYSSTWVCVALASDDEDIPFPGQFPPLSSGGGGLSEFRASD